jgi:hypothetical protein
MDGGVASAELGFERSMPARVGEATCAFDNLESALGGPLWRVGLLLHGKRTFSNSGAC